VVALGLSAGKHEEQEEVGVLASRIVEGMAGVASSAMGVELAG
jgi:hypothetical protein